MYLLLLLILYLNPVNVWAPDINYIGDRYVLYYAMSVWGGEETCGIGVATATVQGRSANWI